MLYKTNFAEGVGRQVHKRELQKSSVLEFQMILWSFIVLNPEKFVSLKLINKESQAK